MDTLANMDPYTKPKCTVSFDAVHKRKKKYNETDCSSELILLLSLSKAFSN